MRSKKILIMAGGTGGHVFPALAIARALADAGHEILWLGARGRMEERLVPRNGFKIEYIKVSGVRRNGLKAKLGAPAMILRATLAALRIVRAFRPDVALGMGGYASGPGGLAACLCGVRLVVHEQNAAAGLTNRLLYRIADRVLLGFPGAFSGSKVSVVGNPVRSEILSLRGARRAFDSRALRIAVVGGSLGAQALNELVPRALGLTGDRWLTVTHQCGRGHLESVKRNYAGAQFSYRAVEFVDDMRELYRTHDLIICRAGALTVAEVACAGIPALFVPLPSAVDDHQTRNARFLADRGAALLCPQTELTAQGLAEIVRDLSAHREKLAAMSAAMAECAVADATERVKGIIENLAGA